MDVYVPSVGSMLGTCCLKFSWPGFRTVHLQCHSTHVLSCFYFSLTSNYTLTPAQTAGR